MGQPKVAWNGSTYLVVWAEAGSRQVFGARVSPSGVVLDAGFQISLTYGTAGQPAVASDGTNFFVVWSEDVGNGYDLRGAHVGPNGEIVGCCGHIIVAAGSGNQVKADVSWNGSTYLVVWQDTRNGGADIYGTRVPRLGFPLDPSGFPISNGLFGQQFPAVAAAGPDFLVVWWDGRNLNPDIYGARVRGDGTVVDGTGEYGGFLISAYADSLDFPSVASDGSNYLVAWGDTRAGYAVFTSVVTPSAAVLQPSGVQVVAGAWPSASWNGSSYLVVSNPKDSSGVDDVWAARVGSTGSVVQSPFPVNTQPNVQGFPDSASNGSDWLAVWFDYRSGTDLDVFAARISGAGSVLEPSGFGVSTAANEQLDPAVASSGPNSLAVWIDYRSPTTPAIYAGRISRQGQPVDGPGILISPSSHDIRGPPAVTWDGTNYVVVWPANDGNWGVFAVRVTSGGRVLDPVAWPIARPGTHARVAAIAWNGSVHLAVWQQDAGTETDIGGVRVKPDLTVLDSSPLMISQAAREQMAPAVASDGRDFFVAWQDFRTGGSFDIYGLEIPGSGPLAGTELEISTAARNQTAPSIAWDRGSYLLAWQDGRGPNSDVYGAIFDPASGEAPVETVISRASGDQTAPAVGVDGAGFLVAWEDRRSGSGADVYAARVADAAVLDPAGIAVASSAEDETNPAAVSDASGRVAIAYVRRASEAPYDRARRVFTRFTPDTAILSGPVGFSVSTSATFAFESSDASATFECLLDDDVFAACASPTRYTSVLQGPHTFKVRAVVGGIADRIATVREWIVDTSPPILDFVRPRQGGIYVDDEFVADGPLGTTTVGALTVVVNAYDSQSGIDAVEFEVDGLRTPADHDPGSDLYRFVLVPTDVPAKTYQIKVTATNAAGLSRQQDTEVRGIPLPQ